MSYRLRVFDSGKIPTRDDAARPISAVRRQQKQSCLSALFIVTKSLKKFTHKSNLCTPLSLSFLLAVLSLSLSPVVFTPFVFPLFLPRPRANSNLNRTTYHQHRAPPGTTYRAVDRCLYNNMVDRPDCQATQLSKIRCGGLSRTGVLPSM